MEPFLIGFGLGLLFSTAVGLLIWNAHLRRVARETELLDLSRRPGLSVSPGAGKLIVFRPGTPGIPTPPTFTPLKY
jgi:hypothetical protein